MFLAAQLINTGSQTVFCDLHGAQEDLFAWWVI